MDFVPDLSKKYALAVSGGVDSMVMLHMFLQLSPAPDFFVVTVNHGLRAEATADCEFVRDYCARSGVECFVQQVDVPSYCKQTGLSEETAARILRYRALDLLPCDYICLAHNANDNVETVLMHILRGSGVKGACGMRKVSGKYLRPLLDRTRAEIEDYARRNCVAYVTDRTNSDVRYKRNFVRHKIMPLLTEYSSSAADNILRFADSARSDDEYLDSLADISDVIFDEGRARVPMPLLTQPYPIAYRVLCKVLAGIGAHKDIERVHIVAILDLCRKEGGKKLDLPCGLTAYNDYNYITLERRLPKDGNSQRSGEIAFAEGATRTPVGTVSVDRDAQPGSLTFDLSKIPQGAVFRTRRSGDRFTKFGGGTKPLKDYLIDKKIPQRRRDELLLVADGSDVLIICGVEISDKVRVDGQSDVRYISVAPLCDN